MYARLGWIDQPMKMRETSRVQDKKPIDNNKLESGFAVDELFTTSEPFLAQNSNFSLGGGNSAEILPKQFPNQKIYAS